MEEEVKKVSAFKRYKWLYLWVAAAALLVFGIVMLVSKTFGTSVVCYVTGALLILFTIIRFVPLIRTTRNSWAIAINAIEMFIDLAVGIAIIVLANKLDEGINTIEVAYRFMVGGVLYIRALVYLVETNFFGTKVEPVKFIINILLITVGTVIMSLKEFNPNTMRYLFGVVFTLCGAVATGDGFINYNNYRKLYVKPKKAVKDDVKDEVVDDVKDEIGEAIPETLIINEDDKREEDYVS